MLINITYNQNIGTPIRDGEVSYIVSKWIADDVDVDFIAGTSNIIEELRLAVAQNKIKPEKIIFNFNNKVIEFDGLFDLKEWPNGFCDLNRHQSFSIFQERRLNKSS